MSRWIHATARLLIALVVAISIGNSESSSFRGIIAGNLTVSDCVTGGRPRNSEEYITTSELIRRSGYEIEEHVVATADGYYLTLHRIPGKSANSTPVFVQHGIVTSSFEWVVPGRKKGLAFILSDYGYDVWLGNSRGNTYSRCHTRYTTADQQYWDFSWHEMGVYDLPAAIRYVNEATKQSVIYIGYSMGTTMFYVMAIERPDIASGVKAMFNLSPVVYMGNMKSPLRILSTIPNLDKLYIRAMRTYEFLSQSTAQKKFFKNLCGPSRVQRDICANFLFLFFGCNPRQFDKAMLPKILTNSPSGMSFKCILHYTQEMNSNKFQYYDYGSSENLKRYNSTQPPEYDVSKIQVPIGIFWSDNDLISHPTDVLRFYNEIPNKIFSHKVKDPLWQHLDYLYGTDAPRLVYSKLLSEMENFR